MIKKAGCILINVNNKKIALVYRDGGYSFPKGHLEQNETLKECAIRETKEETGHNCHLINENDSLVIRYNNSKGQKVETYFYLAFDDGITKDEIKETDKEKTEWINYENVENVLSYQNLKEFWEKIKSKVESVLCNE